MFLYEEFEDITIEYEHKIFNIFKRIIDAGILETKKQNMSPLDQYVYIRNIVENGFRELASVQGYNSDFPQVSDVLVEQIYHYYEPITEEARKALQTKVDEMMECNNLGELMIKLDDFKKMLEEKGIEDYMYQDLDVKKRVI